MRKLLLFLFVLVVVNESVQAQAVFNPERDDDSGAIKKEHLQEYMLALLVKHYEEAFKEPVSEDKDISDSLIALSFYRKTKVDEEDKLLLTVQIPRFTSNYLVSDIDGDGNDEIIGSVRTEGSKIGNYKWDNDIVVFKLVENKFVLYNITSSTTICGCKGGNFYPYKLNKQTLTGQSTCWDELDAACCPTLRYETTVKFTAQKWLFVNKKPLYKK